VSEVNKCEQWDCVHNHEGMCEVVNTDTCVQCEKRTILFRLSGLKTQMADIQGQILKLELQNPKSKDEIITFAREHLKHNRHDQIWHKCGPNGPIRTYCTFLCSVCPPRTDIGMDEKAKLQDFNPMHQIKYLTEELLKLKNNQEEKRE